MVISHQVLILPRTAQHYRHLMVTIAGIQGLVFLTQSPAYQFILLSFVKYLECTRPYIWDTFFFPKRKAPLKLCWIKKEEEWKCFLEKKRRKSNENTLTVGSCSISANHSGHIIVQSPVNSQCIVLKLINIFITEIMYSALCCTEIILHRIFLLRSRAEKLLSQVSWTK